MPFLIYRDKMRAEGPNHYPYILGMALNQYRIDTDDHYLHYITKLLLNIYFLIVFVAEGVYIVFETGLKNSIHALVTQHTINIEF